MPTKGDALRARGVSAPQASRPQDRPPGAARGAAVALRRCAAALLLAVAGCLALPALAHAQTAWVSNTGQTRVSGTHAIGNTDKTNSQGFTTGTVSGGYSLGSVGVYVNNEDLESGETFIVHIYTATATGARDTLVYTLTSPASYTDNAVNLFTAPANARLAASTDYLVVFEGTGNFSTDFTVAFTNSDAEDSGSATGWSIENVRRLNNTQTGVSAFVISVNEPQRPMITSVDLTSDPGADDTYGLDDTITVAVEFDRGGHRHRHAADHAARRRRPCRQPEVGELRQRQRDHHPPLFLRRASDGHG